MGLRERNAAQTRELVLDVALRLFLEHGYEATRMEEVAAAAEIGTSTLYRYFPTKDLLVLEHLAIRGQMASTLLARPAAEPLDVALGHAVSALIMAPRADRARLRQVTALIESSTALQARLLEEFARERTQLAEAVAERLERPYDDQFCVMTAWAATLVLERIAQLTRDTAPDDPADVERRVLGVTRRVMDDLQAEPPVLPRFTPPGPRPPTQPG